MNLHYNAFISYRHAPLDSAVAQDIQQRLEHFKIPAEIRKTTGMTRIERVFRDQEELPITSNLGDDISQALENSDFLIVVCSSSTKESKWVEREVRYFLKTHDRSHVLTAIADGEPLEVIPEILLYDEEMAELEPLSCDYRKGFRTAHRTEIPRLAAPLIGCTYDDLVMRHRQYRMRRILAAMTTAMVLSVAALGYLLWSSSKISDNYRNMQIQQSRYLSAESQELTQKEDRIPAALLALEALPGENSERPLVPAAMAALIAATNTYQVNPEPMNADTVWSFYTKDNVADYFCSEDGKLLVAWDTSAVFVYSIENRELLWKKETEGEIWEVFSPDGNCMVIETAGSIEAVRPEDGAALWKKESSSSELYQRAAAAGEGQLVVVQNFGEALSYLSFWDSGTGEVLWTSETGIEIPMGCTGLLATENREKVVLELPDYREEGSRLVVYLAEEDRYEVVDTGHERARETDFLLLDEDTILLAEHPEEQNYAYSRNGLTQLVDKKAYVSLWKVGQGVLWTREFPFTESGYVTEIRLSAYKKTQEPVILVSAGRNFMILRAEDGAAVEDASLPDTAAECFALRSEEPGFILFLSDGTTLLWNEGTEENLFLRDVFSGKVREVLPFDNGSGSNAYLVHTEGSEIRLYESDVTDPGYTKLADLEEYYAEVTVSFVSGNSLVLRWYDTDLWGWQTQVYDLDKGTRTASILPDRNAGGAYVGVVRDPENGIHRFYCLENTEDGAVRLAGLNLESGGKETIPLTEFRAETGVVRENRILLFGTDSAGENAILKVDPLSLVQEILPIEGLEGTVEQAFVSSDGEDAVVNCKTMFEESCAFVNPEEGTAVSIPGFENTGVTACAFREEDGIFAVCAGTKIAAFKKDGTPLYTIEPDTEKIYFLRFEEGMLAAGGSDGVLRLFDAGSGELAFTTEYTASSVNTSSGGEEYLRWEMADDIRLLVTQGGMDLFDASTWEHLCYIKGARGYAQEKDAFVCLKETPSQIGWLHRYSTQELIEKGKQFVMNAEMDAEKKARYGLAGE